MIGHIKFLPWRKLDGCSVTIPFLSVPKGVACDTSLHVWVFFGVCCPQTSWLRDRAGDEVWAAGSSMTEKILCATSHMHTDLRQSMMYNTAVRFKALIWLVGLEFIRVGLGFRVLLGQWCICIYTKISRYTVVMYNVWLGSLPGELGLMVERRAACTLTADLVKFSHHGEK